MYATHQISIIVDLIYRYSYLILFPLVVIEGPIVTIVAGFLASVGFLGIIPAYLTIILGDLVGDILYYCAGRYWLKSTYRKVLSFFMFDVEKARKIEKTLKNHRGKVLFFGKLSHAIGVLILFVAGVAEVPFGEFIWFNLLATIPKSLILLSVGYYFGSTISNFGRYLNFTVLGLLLFTLILIGVYFAITYISNKFLRKVEK